LPGRSIVKLLPDYIRPRVLALNQANGSVPGTVMALDPTNGAILGEISVNLNPTDMATSPAGDALYVVNAGGRTISKVDLISLPSHRELKKTVGNF
jgi:DNA-binding beta-propeller fold protein YncE